MKIGFKLLLIILFFQSIALFGQEKVDLSQWQGKSRPRIGFVLGGGGARGAAHIGVLKYLYEQGIPVDYVVGTSMGSIIGALYCVGYTPEELENLIAEMDWSIYMKDAVDRKYYSTEEKERREKFLLTVPFNTRGAFRNPFTNSSVQGNSTNVISTLPSSFVNGSNLQNLFNDLTFDYSGTGTDFNDLPINFACIATDILTGEEVVINKGDLPLAIRASMAIPGLFAPVDYDGRLLVDGGLVNNFPSDVCRSMGADIIIGSEVAKGKIESLDDLKSLPQLLAQMKNLAVEGKNVENRKLCNYYFHPDLSGFGMLSFSADAIHTLVQAGYEQAKEHDAEIQELKKLLARYPADKERLKAPHTRNFQNTGVNINNVDFHGITDKEESFLTRKSHLTPNTVFDGKKLNESVSIIKGTGSFSRVVYKLNKIDSTHYDVDMRLQRIEPHTISLGFRYDSEESAALLLGLGINSYQLSGLKFKVDARLSYNPRITTTLTWAALSFASINLSYEFFSPHYDIYYESMLFESNTGKSHTFTLSISEFHMRYLSMKAGVFRESKKIKGALSSLFLNSKTTYRKLGAFASVRFDSRDDVAYAKKGMYFNAEAQLGFSDDYELSHKIIDSDSAIYDINGDFRIYISPYNGPVTLIPQVRFRSISGNYNADFDANYFGGSIDKRYYNSHLAFLGDDDLTWTYANVAILRLDVRWNFYKKHYLTGSYNYLHSTNTIESFFGTDDEFEKLLTKNYHGIAVKYTYKSVIGPISLQYHYSDVKDSSGLYFSLGYDF